MEPDPQELLPADLRRSWAAVPRDTLYQIFLVGAIIGAGTALSITGWVIGSAPLSFGFPAALVAAQLQNWALPWERRALLALGVHHDQRIAAAQQAREREPKA